MVNHITISQTLSEIYYFDSYDTDGARLGWEDNPGQMVDGLLTNFAQTSINNRIQWLDENTALVLADRPITKVEFRAYGSASSSAVLPGPYTQYLRPVFIAGQGDTHSWSLPGIPYFLPVPNWSEWFDITSDTNAPGTWTWADVVALDMDTWTVKTPSGDPQSAQCYKVEMKVSCLSECTLTAPEEVSDDHSQNVKMLNLWNGERIVFGLSRSKWGLILTGREWYSGACDRIICVRDLGLNDLHITISGLNNINWDGDWQILSFGWKIINECPEHIEWILELEKYG